jgi:hypothetical protein
LLMSVLALSAYGLMGSAGARAEPPESHGPPENARPGDVVVDHGIAAIVPRPNLAVLIDALGEDGEQQQLVISTDAQGNVSFDSWGEEPDAAEADAFTALTAPDPCQDEARDLNVFKWTHDYGWTFKADTAPDEVGVDNTEAKLKDATANITNSRGCSMEDFVSASHQYNGRNNNYSDNIYLTKDNNNNLVPACGTDDTHNVTQFGDLPVKDEGGTKNYLAVTCTWWNSSGNVPHEAVGSDMRLNKEDYKWIADPTSADCKALDNGDGRWAVEAVATHERGHTFGLQHVGENEHGNLTMSPSINGTCQDSESTLGRRDILGLRDLY